MKTMFTLRYRLILVSLGLLLFLFTGFTSIKAFHIECPPDTLVDCGTDVSDLSVFGTAYVFGYGAPEPIEPWDIVYYYSDCGVGTITRIWMATDYSGTMHTCQQVIYIGSTNILNGSFIEWPPDYTTHECYANLDPQHLPSPYDKPIYDVPGNCHMLMAGYKDQIFNLAPPACVKVLRTWTILDWCIYDPNSGSNAGKWEHVQVLKITPENPPEIVCPASMTVSADMNCNGTWVDIPEATATTDCGAIATITNNSPYADSNGADASGHYPFGTTWVKFEANDGCGNKSTCMFEVTVYDGKQPTPICYHGISANLSMHPDGYYLELFPELFNKGSYDNCTDEEDLIYWVEPEVVTCEDLGVRQVFMYVQDESGNVEHCETYIILSDHLGICPEPLTYAISGQIKSEEGVGLEETRVMLETPDLNESMTDIEGSYTFNGLEEGIDCKVQPESSEDYTNGISTYDLILIQKHILGLYEISSPYKLISADVDNSNDISVYDIVTLRKLLLGIDEVLPGVPSWRFIPADQEFSNPMNPFNQVIDGYMNLPTLSSDLTHVDFIAMKMGDVSGDALYTAQNRDRDIFRLNYELMNEGQLVFTADQALEIDGFQMSINLGEVDLSAVDILPGIINSTEMSYFIKDNNINISVITPKGKTVNANDILFEIDVTAMFQSSNIELSLTESLLPELYQAGEIGVRTLEIQPLIPDHEHALLRYLPIAREIEYSTSDGVNSTIQVVNTAGKIVLLNTQIHGQGSLFLPSGLTTGIYFMMIQTESDSEIKKIYVH